MTQYEDKQNNKHNTENIRHAQHRAPPPKAGVIHGPR